jgi:hypothetical protein
MEYFSSSIEFLLETRRADFRREVEQLNLIREAERKEEAHQNWMNKIVHDLGIWMMKTGERLHARHQAPAPLPRWHQGTTLAR